jgi:hypothetical protein
VEGMASSAPENSRWMLAFSSSALSDLVLRGPGQRAKDGLELGQHWSLGPAQLAVGPEPYRHRVRQGPGHRQSMLLPQIHVAEGHLVDGAKEHGPPPARPDERVGIGVLLQMLELPRAREEPDPENLAPGAEDGGAREAAVDGE